MNSILAGIIPLVFFGLVLLMVFYIGSRLGILFNVKSKRAVIISLVLVMTGSVAAIFGAVKSTGGIIGWLSITGGYFLVFSVCLLISLLVMHLLQPIFKLPNVVSGWIAVILALIPTFLGAIQALHFRVNEVTVQMPKLDNALDIMLISDVHLGHHRGKGYLAKL
jgi:hypothetical protein